MSSLRAIFQAIQFIETHLTEEITVAEMAEAAGYSLYHFCRTFNGTVHHTPYDYLMRRRLSQAARALVDTDRKIIDVAFDHQFNSAETFSRAFKRMFGIQPQQWRKTDRLDRRQLMLPLTLAHLEHFQQRKCLKPTLVEKPVFHVAGLMTLVQNEPAVVGQLWQMVEQELAGPAAAGDRYGLIWHPPGGEQTGYFYLAGVEISSPDTAGSNLVVKTAPASTYASFTHCGGRARLNLTLDYIYQTWLPQSGRRLAFPLEVDYFGRRIVDLDDEQARWEIQIPVTDLPTQSGKDWDKAVPRK